MNLALIRGALAGHKPRPLRSPDDAYAAVAMILCGNDARPEVLLIERAHHTEDPWSGQMAFPGGRCETHDPGARHTAERETREEIAVDLTAAEYLGQLDDQHGRVTEIIVHCFVYYRARLERPQLNHEVQAVHCTPLENLAEHHRQLVFRPLPSLTRDYPGIRMDTSGERVIWGLTYRFLATLFTLAGRPLPGA